MKPGQFGIERERLIKAIVTSGPGRPDAVVRSLTWAKLNLLALKLGVL